MDKPETSSANLLNLRLQKSLASCSESVLAGDLKKSEESVLELVDLLNSVSDAIELGKEDEELGDTTAFEVVSEIDRFISSPTLDQTIIDALSFELPKAVATLSCLSDRCLEVAERTISRFIETCSPRDMISILCETLSSPSKRFKTPGYFAPLFNALAKVFASIQRKPFLNMKAAVPVILNVLEAMSSEQEIDESVFEDLFHRAISIAHSMQTISEGTSDKKLTALVGLFILQVMALVSITLGNKFSKCYPIVIQLLNLLRYCSLSYSGLMTGRDVDMIVELISVGDGDDFMNSFSYVKHGAVLTVIWCHASNEADDGIKEDLVTVKDELRRNRVKRWESLGMLKHVFASVKLPWELKRHAIDFLICIMEGSASHNGYDESVDYSVYMPILYAALQVLADIPASLRFDILVALIKNCEISSMIAILLGCFKDEMHKESLQRIQLGKVVNEEEMNSSQDLSFWRAEVLDLVEFVLRPSKGGPPSLPEFVDAVSSALNLYRFVLITESSGKRNYTGVLSKHNLQKANNEWLQPLRTLISGIVSESQKDEDELAFHRVCTLNPIELVLYRCLELVEENLKHST